MDDAPRALPSRIFVQAGQHTAQLTDDEYKAVVAKDGFLLTYADQDTGVVNLPMLASIPETWWRVLFPFDPSSIPIESLPGLYERVLYVDSDDSAFRRVLAFHMTSLATFDQFRHVYNAWKLTPKEYVHRQVYFQGAKSHELSKPPFSVDHFEALLYRLALQREPSVLLDFYHGFTSSLPVSEQVPFFNVVHQFVARHFRNGIDSHQSACPNERLNVLLLKLHDWLPFKDRIRFQHFDWRYDVASVFETEPAIVGTPEPGPCEKAIFIDRFDALSGGFCRFEPIRQALELGLIVVAGGAVAHCLSTRYANQGFQGRDIDVFVLVGSRIGSPVDRQQRVQDAFNRVLAFASHFTGNTGVVQVNVRFNIIEIFIPGLPMFQLIPIGRLNTGHLLNDFDVTSRMVAYDGKDVLTNYDGLQSWVTGSQVVEKEVMNKDRARKIISWGFSTRFGSHVRFPEQNPLAANKSIFYASGPVQSLPVSDIMTAWARCTNTLPYQPGMSWYQDNWGIELRGENDMMRPPRSRRENWLAGKALHPLNPAIRYHLPFSIFPMLSTASEPASQPNVTTLSGITSLNGITTLTAVQMDSAGM